jgi:DNA-binding HxlR family transcriptional regulator
MAHALNLVGERWALLVVRELMLGPKRFTDLRSGLPGISPNILTQRLRELGYAGIVRHSKLPPPASHQIYELTERGQELETVVDALGRWGLRSLALAPAPRSKDSQVLFLRILFDPVAAGDFAANLALWLGGECFRVEIADGRISLTRDRPDHADATIETTIPVLHALLRGTRTVSELTGSGKLRVQGDHELVARLPGLFAYPQGDTALFV